MNSYNQVAGIGKQITDVNFSVTRTLRGLGVHAGLRLWLEAMACTLILWEIVVVVVVRCMLIGGTAHSANRNIPQTRGPSGETGLTGLLMIATEDVKH